MAAFFYVLDTALCFRSDYNRYVRGLRDRLSSRVLPFLGFLAEKALLVVLAGWSFWWLYSVARGYPIETVVFVALVSACLLGIASFLAKIKGWFYWTDLWHLPGLVPLYLTRKLYRYSRSIGLVLVPGAMGIIGRGLRSLWAAVAWGVLGFARLPVLVLRLVRDLSLATGRGMARAVRTLAGSLFEVCARIRRVSRGPTSRPPSSNAQPEESHDRGPRRKRAQREQPRVSERRDVPGEVLFPSIPPPRRPRRRVAAQLLAGIAMLSTRLAASLRLGLTEMGRVLRQDFGRLVILVVLGVALSGGYYACGPLGSAVEAFVARDDCEDELDNLSALEVQLKALRNELVASTAALEQRQVTPQRVDAYRALREKVEQLRERFEAARTSLGLAQAARRNSQNADVRIQVARMSNANEALTLLMDELASLRKRAVSREDVVTAFQNYERLRDECSATDAVPDAAASVADGHRKLERVRTLLHKRDAMVVARVSVTNEALGLQIDELLQSCAARLGAAQSSVARLERELSSLTDAEGQAKRRRDEEREQRLDAEAEVASRRQADDAAMRLKQEQEQVRMEQRRRTEERLRKMAEGLFGESSTQNLNEWERSVTDAKSSLAGLPGLVSAVLAEQRAGLSVIPWYLRVYRASAELARVERLDDQRWVVVGYERQLTDYSTELDTVVALRPSLPANVEERIERVRRVKQGLQSVRDRMATKQLRGLRPALDGAVVEAKQRSVELIWQAVAGAVFLGLLAVLLDLHRRHGEQVGLKYVKSKRTNSAELLGFLAENTFGIAVNQLACHYLTCLNRIPDDLPARLEDIAAEKAGRGGRLNGAKGDILRATAADIRKQLNRPDRYVPAEPEPNVV